MAYDSAATKERILTAAAAEFAEHGVAGARVDRIAAAAAANKRAIYDYFGDKQALFAAVLERLMTDLAEAVPPGDDADLGVYAGSLFDYHRANPEALRLLLWEALEMGEDPVPDEETRTRHYLDKVGAAETAAGAHNGDPRALLFFTLGLVGWSLAMPQLRRMILGSDYTPERLREAVSSAVRALAGSPTAGSPHGGGESTSQPGAESRVR
ncbi:TetR family transcriptional regulator [Phytomonospora endophytica]|uniref:AcrR family transcriptional regulator n=1 Tax=Phytomonospora endophytica TaxID=714109 RepID=A0A841FE82_9ACTN|nr:TetR family transcriptional regulator [Phytomonospora endophytica]MBB6033323.1 AcrR family transcriptional regulator [Phytomonospora endophytica]GIG65550.1 putative TetR family regulatory protein [Phytomonospora endophytica]